MLCVDVIAEAVRGVLFTKWFAVLRGVVQPVAVAVLVTGCAGHLEKWGTDCEQKTSSTQPQSSATGNLRDGQACAYRSVRGIAWGYYPAQYVGPYTSHADDCACNAQCTGANSSLLRPE